MHLFIFQKNATYPYFKFCDSFAAKEDQAACSQYLQAFVSSLGKMHESSADNDFVRTLFEARIPIKVLIKFKSNFYKRKLLQMYIDAGLDTFLPQNCKCTFSNVAYFFMLVRVMLKRAM